MRLFLSSQSFGKYGDELVRLVGDNLSVLYIANAKDDWTPSASAEKVAEHKQEFEAFGFSFEVIELRRYVNNKKDLAGKLAGKGLVWASGGNTFLLRRALKDSGMDKLLIEGLIKDAFCYGGSSAGSIVMTPSLHGVEMGDNPEAVSEIYGGEVVWDGLGQIQKYIVPHVNSEWFKQESDAMVEYMKQHNLPYYALEDGQVVVVDGDKEELLI